MTYSIDDSFSTLFSYMYIILFLYIIVYRKVIKGKKSKHITLKDIIISIFFSLISGYMAYIYVQKKNKEIQENRYGLKYPLMTSFTVFLLYNMFILEEGAGIVFI